MPSPVRTLRVVDGFTWRFDRKPTYDSFVNPNATCPVCGASVYFYQSPFGGRVFFDELGPPWSKHPCTDNGRLSNGRERGHDYILGPARSPAPKTPSLFARDAWRPLLVEEIEHIGDFDRLRMPLRDRLAGTFLYVPDGWIGDAPAYWRWSPTDPAMVEVSCIRLGDQSDLENRSFSVPGWLRGNEDFDRWRADPNGELPPEALNAIGFALSFAWRIHNGPTWHLGIPCVDFHLAKSYFERAAASGYWAAINNLGVMYRDGLGVERDPVRAFELFDRAAQSLDTTPLRHLATCHRDGFGCEPDLELVNYLEELIAVREGEENPAA